MADAAADRPDSGDNLLPTVAATTLRWWTDCWLAPLQLSIAVMDAVLVGDGGRDTGAVARASTPPSATPVAAGPRARAPSAPAIRPRAPGSVRRGPSAPASPPAPPRRMPPTLRIVTRQDSDGEVDYVD